MALIITLSPCRDDRALTLSRAGRVLTITGIAVDLDAEIPEAAIDWIIGPVETTGSDTLLTLLFPIGPNAPAAACFPVPLRVEADGPVALPPRDAT
ncbi:hypothetical protein [Rhodobacter maris]|uniref:Uncharacterized protein n=1 Tax=Rhodobacter maris TaxID=446682 RepID=A0A285TIQ8_9RHOB|nr:hypothetical protein [Rhodobacter maris]SOC22127.1 hypothetical protein SAMN05877831_12713 [Rhodobacter maris]